MISQHCETVMSLILHTVLNFVFKCINTSPFSTHINPLHKNHHFPSLMALSRNHHHLFLTFALTSIFLSSLAPSSGGIRASSSKDEEELRKMVLGSRPPACVNRCMSCRPCEATLVIPPHQSRMKWKWANYEEASHREDDSYYLLSWKCRCGNKLYQP